MLALFYLISLSLGGISMVSWLRLKFNIEGRFTAGLVLGQMGGVWLLYLISSLTGNLSIAAIILTSSLLLLPFLATMFTPGTWFKGKESFWKPFLSKKAFSVEFLVLLSFLCLFFVLLNLHAILPPDKQGNLYATEHVWADTPYHVSLINSFVHRDNFPPYYPILLNAPLRYPFLVDLHTAALIKGGMDLRQGIAVSNILLQVPIFLLIYLLAQTLGGSRRTGLLTSLIFLFLGNFGFLLAFQDISQSGGFISWLQHLLWGYTGSSLGVESRESLGVGLYLGNPVYLFFMPRRAVIFGFAASLMLMLILLEIARTKERSLLPFITAGFLLGLLPRVHTHSFIVMALFTGFVIVSRPMWHLKDSKDLDDTGKNKMPYKYFYVNSALLLGIASLIALPQVLNIREQVGSNFFKFWPGWIGEPHDALTSIGKGATFTEQLTGTGKAAIVFIKFWFWNGGLLLLLLPFALWKASRNQRLFYPPFILLFIAGNLIKLQPWEWDNNNLFLYWQLGTVLLVSLFLAGLCGCNSPVPASIDREKRQLNSANNKSTRVASSSGFTNKLTQWLCLLCVFILITGGILNIIRTSQEKNLLWSETDVKIGKWVRDNTPPDSLFLTGSAHNHPVPSLGGRQIVMGFEGWLFSHGLSYVETQRDEEKMLQGDISLMKRYGVDYIALTPYEKYFAASRGFNLDASFFRNPELFELVYSGNNQQGTWEVYRLR